MNVRVLITVRRTLSNARRASLASYEDPQTRSRSICRFDGRVNSGSCNRRARTRSASMRLERPSSQAAPRTPAMSAPVSQMSGRFSAVSFPASATSRPARWPASTHLSSVESEIRPSRPAPSFCAVSSRTPPAPARAATSTSAVGPTDVVPPVSAYATATTLLCSRPAARTPRTAAVMRCATRS